MPSASPLRSPISGCVACQGRHRAHTCGRVGRSVSPKKTTASSSPSPSLRISRSKSPAVRKATTVPSQTQAKSLDMSSYDTNIAVGTVQVDDKVYNAMQLAQIHPGGEMFVRAFAGHDASEAFLSYHRRRFPHAKMKSHLICSAKPRKSNPEEDDKDYLELCEVVDKEIGRLQSWAPWHYYIKAFVILGSCVSLEMYMHYHADYRWQYSACMGFIMALIGLNIQHDANHGAISRNSWVNRFFGLSQNWIGGSAVDWVHQHVVQHHVHCNDVNDDPDIMGGWLLRLNPTKPLLEHQWAQYIYVFCLLALFGFNVVVQSILHLWRGKHLKDMSSLLFSYRILESCTWLVFMVRWIALPIYRTRSAWVLVSLSPMYSIAGFYLSFFFIISHNFDGAEMFDRSKGLNAKNSFLYKQVASSSNVGGAFLGFLNGGLNYQIEHHLFPRMSHCHYPRIAPIVRAFCAKKCIPYVHFPTIGSNVASTVTHLWKMGRGKGRITI